MLSWITAVEKVLLPMARSLVEIGYRFLRKKVRKEFTVLEISEALEEGKLSFDKRFNVVGVFSEYLPFVDFTTLIKSDFKSEITSSCRLGDIVRSGTYLGALFAPEAQKANEPAIPIIYTSTGESRKIFSFSTGDKLKLECRLVPLDYEFRSVLQNKEYFCFKEKLFGLEIFDVLSKKPKKVDKFVIDAFFLGSLEYEGGPDCWYSLLDEIVGLWPDAENMPSIIIELCLNKLHRIGLLGLDVTDSEDALIAHHDWVNGNLYKISRPIDILDTAGSKVSINDMKEHIAHLSFIETDLLHEWGAVKSLLQGKLTRKQKKLLSRDKMLAHFARALHNRAELLKAWDFLLEPTINVDFQFDQVCPIVKQSINPRKILKQKGFM